MPQAKVALAEVRSLGKDLHRPECVLATKRGDLFVAHLGHGVLRIHPDGRQEPIGRVAQVDGQPWIPNGFAWTRDGAFLVANMGPAGGLWRLGRDGHLSLALGEVDGRPLGATNFVVQDSRGRSWITVTTRRWPISEAMAPLGGPYVEDGYLILMDDKGARVVAEGFAFANEVRLDREERHAYVVETFGRRITRFRVAQDGSLSGREVFTTFGHGTFADGAAFDAEGHLWVASIISNRLIRIAPDGRQEVILEESDPAFVDGIEKKLAARSIAREDVQRTPTRVLKNIASITFGGEDLRTVYLGSLGGDTLAVFRAGVAGLPPVHWNYQP
jgi:sugar lactone lactonase YvrE